MIVRPDHFIAQPQFLDQRKRFGFLADEAVGSGIENAVFPTLRFDHAAQPRLFFEKDGLDAGPRQIVGRRKPRDPAADDDYFFRV